MSYTEKQMTILQFRHTRQYILRMNTEYVITEAYFNTPLL